MTLFLRYCRLFLHYGTCTRTVQKPCTFSSSDVFSCCVPVLCVVSTQSEWYTRVLFFPSLKQRGLHSCSSRYRGVPLEIFACRFRLYCGADFFFVLRSFAPVFFFVFRCLLSTGWVDLPRTWRACFLLWQRPTCLRSWRRRASRKW